MIVLTFYFRLLAPNEIHIIAGRPANKPQWPLYLRSALMPDVDNSNRMAQR